MFPHSYRYVILGLGLGGLELPDDDGDEVRAHDGRLCEPDQPRVVVDGVLPIHKIYSKSIFAL